MTTLAALSTKNAAVLRCDSLGTITRCLIDPEDLIEFFDADKNFQLKSDKNGKPL